MRYNTTDIPDQMRTTRLLVVLALPLLAGCAILESSAGPRVTVNLATQPLDDFSWSIVTKLVVMLWQ